MGPALLTSPFSLLGWDVWKDGLLCGASAPWWLIDTWGVSDREDQWEGQTMTPPASLPPQEYLDVLGRPMVLAGKKEAKQVQWTNVCRMHW